MSQEIEVIHTGEIDINRDEILLYAEYDAKYITDDGYCSFELGIHNITLDITSGVLSKLLKAHGCKIKENHDIVRPFTGDTYHHDDVVALTECYQAIQSTMILKGR